MLPVIIAYAVLYLVWGSTYWFIKEAVHTLHPGLVVGIRFSLGGLMLLGLGMALGRFKRLPSAAEWRAAAILAVLLILGGNGLVTIAEKKVDSYVAALIIATTPLTVALFNRMLLKLPLPLPGLAGLFAGLLGVALVLYDGSSFASSLNPQVLLILAAVGCWSLGTSLGKSLKAFPDVLISSGLQCLVGGAVSLALFAVIRKGDLPDLSGVTLSSWLALAYLTVPGSLAFFAYGFLITREPSFRVVSYALVNPAIAVLLGLSMGEAVQPYLWFGLPLILTGVFLMLYGAPLLARLRGKSVNPSVG